MQVRTFYHTPIWRKQESSSKVEDTVKVMKEKKEESDKKMAIKTSTAEVTEKAIVPKLSLWGKVKAEILHYYHGFRLLSLDMKISAKLIWRILHGNELNRREHRLVKLKTPFVIITFYCA